MAQYRKGALTSWYRSKMAQVDAGVDDALEEAGSKGEGPRLHFLKNGTTTEHRRGRF